MSYTGSLRRFLDSCREGGKLVMNLGDAREEIFLEVEGGEQLGLSILGNEPNLHFNNAGQLILGLISPFLVIYRGLTLKLSRFMDADGNELPLATRVGVEVKAILSNLEWFEAMGRGAIVDEKSGLRQEFGRALVSEEEVPAFQQELKKIHVIEYHIVKAS